MTVRNSTPVVTLPPRGPLTQGTIFTCAVAEHYQDCATFGLVITARCDAAQDKVRTYNYLPIVSLKDWLRRDGLLILAEQIKEDSEGGMQRALKVCGFSATILETETPRSILETLFLPSEKKSKAAKELSNFEALCVRHELAASALSNPQTPGVYEDIVKELPKLGDSLIKNLVHHKLGGYYFLSRLEPDGDDGGYVVLIREVQSLPRGAVHAIAEALEASILNDMCKAEPALQGRLRIGPDDLAMPIGLLGSPNLEHLMQTFSTLFGRIGLADPDPNEIAKLCSSQQLAGQGG